MNLEHILRRAFLLDWLLREKKTGNIDELAIKLELSKRQTYKYLKTMKDIGRPNKFDHSEQSYVYTEDTTN